MRTRELTTLELTTLHGDIMTMEPGDDYGFENRLMLGGVKGWEALSLQEVKMIRAYMSKWIATQSKPKRLRKGGGK